MDIDSRETIDLIASDKVEGTAVYGADGDRLGTIERFMVGKMSGQVEYAVMSFGGLFGMGHSHYPLPWQTLTYDTDKGGYVVSLTKEQLENAPRYDQDEPTYDRAYGEQVHGYYGLNYA
ncbi:MULTISPECIES: PRC-barrel domain-containing protein [unclassified Sphingomonas]|jgi:hypothetical protein|uniref:PRC-barrel domain-containing protein n=1 Tax=unclassified Sphingomonas TaxID=196159 RepID=UPI00082B4FF9|nr:MULTISPECIES: PRC-barrel domain-containing protein [unclassified Sphingomonas]MCH4893052.1 PRC-barrel domain containing protein [Sphingomonas sp. SFZ2018-12]